MASVGCQQTKFESDQSFLVFSQTLGARLGAVHSGLISHVGLASHDRPKLDALEPMAGRTDGPPSVGEIAHRTRYLKRIASRELWEAENASGAHQGNEFGPLPGKTQEGLRPRNRGKPAAVDSWKKIATRLDSLDTPDEIEDPRKAAQELDEILEDMTEMIKIRPGY
jgi:hypothetical protein